MSQAMAGNPAEGNEGKPERCDKCHSPYAIDPSKRKKTLGDSSQKPRFRKRLDVESNKILTLCNKCGLAMSRAKKRAPKKPLPTEEEKKYFLEEAKAFAESLAERLQEPDAKYLYCPNVKSNPCGCLQKYIKGEEDSPRVYERALYLTSLLKNAKELSTEKMHTASSSGVSGHTSEKSDTILCRGIGNRHSKMFEDFVLSNRKYLREQLKLCERASQKILMYSNNFLHKELKSLKNQRVEHKSSKYAKMKPITELTSISCCKDQCVQQAITQPDILESWRLSAQEGQKEARRVLAEMLTPSVGTKSNCYRFISLVTGCSFSTICSVNSHLKKTNGSTGPPEHGLKRWWRENPKKSKRKEGPASKKSFKLGDKCYNDEDLELEAAVVNCDLMSPASNLPPPAYETVLCSKESVIQMESSKQPLFELEEKVSVEELKVEEHQEIVETTVQQNPQNAMASTSSLLQNTVQNLLLSPDIVSVTILAAPKSPSRHAQIMAMDNLAKDGILLSQAVESGQRINSANTRQVIQLSQQASLPNSDVKQNMSKDNKLASDIGGNYTMQQPIAERLANYHCLPTKSSPDAVQRRQLLHVFEIPHREPLPQTSATYFSEKTQSQLLSIVSPSDLESITGAAMSDQGGGSCMRSLIILPETIVVDPSLPGSKNTILPTGVSQNDTEAKF